MGFRDLNEFFDSALELPVRGKLYRIESPDAATGLWCQRLFNVAVAASSGQDVTEDDAAKLKLDDDQERDLFQRLLGDTLDEMVSDGLKWSEIQHVGKTAFFWTALGAEQAEQFWNTGGVGKAPAAKQPQDRKRKQPTGQKGRQG